MEKSPKVADEKYDSEILCKHITNIGHSKTDLLLTKLLNGKVAKSRR